MTTGWTGSAVIAGIVVVGLVAVVPHGLQAQDEPGPAGQAPAAADGATADTAADPVVARLNGEDIYRSEALLYRNRLATPLRNAPEEEVLPILVNVLIDSRLAAADARRRGIAEEPEMRTRIDTITDQVLEQEVLSRHVSEQITEDVLRSAYDQLGADPENREQVRARHILLETREAADAIIAELDAGGDFEALAREHSTGPSAERGGDLGFFVRSQMVQPFSDAAFALEVGSYTAEPVETQFGWHVIKVEELGTRQVPPFEEMEGFLRRELSQHMRSEYLTELRESAVIAILP